jgi:single-stranded-DNA-specific exonuclease
MNPIVKAILAKRGLTTEQDITAFLNPDYETLVDPFLLPDMKPAVQRIKQALEANEKIVIYGDYDVDGMTASTLLTEALRCFGAKQVETYTPDRFAEGYGVNSDAIKTIAAAKTNLLITVDCGSLSHAEIELANSLDLDVIVTDHHGLAPTLPPAVAIINPHRPDAECSFKDYAGVGVTFQLVRALQQKLPGLPVGQEKWLLDLVALGTISDIVPLIGDNRTLVYWGLKVLAKTRRLGLKALIAVARVNQAQVSSRDVGFALGPRLNAAGRLETATIALSLLNTTDNSTALTFAEKLDILNRARRKEQDHIFEQVHAKLKDDPNPVLVISAPDWSHGIIGIVASKIVESLQKPVFILEELEGGIAKGSGRSFGDFELHKAIEITNSLLIRGGGHAAAAGVTIKTADIPAWRQALNDYYESLNLKNQSQHLRVQSDHDLTDLAPLTTELVHDLAALEPFGMGNERPVFKLDRVRAQFVDRIGAQKDHLKLTVTDRHRQYLKLLAFGPPPHWFVEPNLPLTLWIHPEINEWQGTESVEGRILNLELKVIQ